MPTPGGGLGFQVSVKAYLIELTVQCVKQAGHNPGWTYTAMNTGNRRDKISCLGQKVAKRSTPRSICRCLPPDSYYQLDYAVWSLSCILMIMVIRGPD